MSYCYVALFIFSPISKKYHHVNTPFEVYKYINNSTLTDECERLERHRMCTTIDDARNFIRSTRRGNGLSLVSLSVPWFAAHQQDIKTNNVPHTGVVLGLSYMPKYVERYCKVCALGDLTPWSIGRLSFRLMAEVCCRVVLFRGTDCMTLVRWQRRLSVTKVQARNHALRDAPEPTVLVVDEGSALFGYWCPCACWRRHHICYNPSPTSADLSSG